MKFRVPTSARSLAALAVAVVLVVGVAGVLSYRASTSDAVARVDNQAFLAIDSTSAVIEQTRHTVQRAFTFDPDSIPAARRAARRSLVGEAVTQYARLYDPLFKQGRTTGLRLTTTVRSIGVASLTGDRAELLVLADQTAASPDGQSTTGAAQLVVSAELRGGQWMVARIRLL